jgi:hypothetical protein
MNDRLDRRCAEPVTGSAIPAGEIRKEKWLAAGHYGDAGVLERAAARRRRDGVRVQALAGAGRVARRRQGMGERP